MTLIDDEINIVLLGFIVLCIFIDFEIRIIQCFSFYDFKIYVEIMCY